MNDEDKKFSIISTDNNGAVMEEHLSDTVEKQDDIIKDYIDVQSNDVVRPYIESNQEQKDSFDIQPSIPDKTNNSKTIDSEETTYNIRRVYVNFQTRVTLLVMGIIMMFGIACYLIISTLQQYESHKTNYLEKTDIHYEVCQNQNSCQKENEMYHANKISTININYNYDAQFEEEINYKFSYYIVAVHSIYNRYDFNKVSYEQEEILTEKEILRSTGKKAEIEVNTEIDFKKYHSFVEDYKKKYSEISHSSLSVVLYVDDGLSSHMAGELSIPLASDKFSIVTNNIENIPHEYRYHTGNWSQLSVIRVVVGCILVILSLLLLFRLTKLVLAAAGKKTKYQEYLRIILNEYDRLIINTKDGFDISTNKKLVKVYTMDELLEIRNSINKPIIFSRINNVKSEFVVEDEENVYKFVLKEADMGE